MKVFKILALVGAMLFVVIGVDLVGYAIAWVPFVLAMCFVLSDKKLMEDLGA